MIKNEDRCSEISLDEFAEKIKSNLEEYFGDTKKVSINKVMKNNGVNLTGITLMSDNSNIAPTVYIDGCYERYIKGELYAQIMNELISTLENHIIDKSMNMEFFCEYEKVKDNIVMKLINKDRNIELLREIPNVDFINMSIVFYYAFDENIFDDKTVENQYSIAASILITNAFLKQWNISLDELYENAYNNTRDKMGIEVQNLTDLMKDILISKFENIDDEYEKEHLKSQLDDMFYDFDTSKELKRMLVLTSSNKQYGAVNIIFSDILKQISEEYSSDLIILPSSIHEVIIIVNDNNIKTDDLKAMVNEVNVNEVPMEEILSDSIYIFERKVSKIRLLA